MLKEKNKRFYSSFLELEKQPKKGLKGVKTAEKREAGAFRGKTIRNSQLRDGFAEALNKKPQRG